MPYMPCSTCNQKMSQQAYYKHLRECIHKYYARSIERLQKQCTDEKQHYLEEIVSIKHTYDKSIEEIQTLHASEIKSLLETEAVNKAVKHSQSSPLKIEVAKGQEIALKNQCIEQLNLKVKELTTEIKRLNVELNKQKECNQNLKTNFISIQNDKRAFIYKHEQQMKSLKNKLDIKLQIAQQKEAELKRQTTRLTNYLNESMKKNRLGALEIRKMHLKQIETHTELEHCRTKIELFKSR